MVSYDHLSFILFWLVFLIGEGAAEVAEKQGIIHEESFVNLRSGPGLSHPSKAVLRKGEKVSIESEEAGWYLVSSTDGERGYVSREFVLLIENAEVEVPPKEEIVAETADKVKSEIQKSLPSESKTEISKRSKANPKPVVQVLGEKNWEILRWLGAALCVFIIGWIFGGNYYLHRDRINRGKLRF